MNDTDRRRKEQLGIPYGTAAHRLRKMLMYSMANQLHLLNCGRCHKPIISINEFSIDHKINWLDNDPGLFWDLENIQFAHSKCNTAASRRMKKKQPIKHGTHNAYASGCRCKNCTQAHAKYQSSYYKSKTI